MPRRANNNNNNCKAKGQVGNSRRGTHQSSDHIFININSYDYTAVDGWVGYSHPPRGKLRQRRLHGEGAGRRQPAGYPRGVGIAGPGAARMAVWVPAHGTPALRRRGLPAPEVLTHTRTHTHIRAHAHSHSHTRTSTYTRTHTRARARARLHTYLHGRCCVSSAFARARHACYMPACLPACLLACFIAWLRD